LAGAIDATILLPPFNFFAESAGFRTLGLSVDYTPELPFTGAVANRNWAMTHRATLEPLILVHNQSVAWFLDPRNREPAIALMVQATRQKPEDVAKAYDFLQSRNFFDASGQVSRTKMKCHAGRIAGAGRHLARAQCRSPHLGATQATE
jgi:ABC-type nitrate/sulfonate/bicarbonate transport system substrate-binding protein